MRSLSLHHRGCIVVPQTRKERRELVAICREQGSHTLCGPPRQRRVLHKLGDNKYFHLDACLYSLIAVTPVLLAMMFVSHACLSCPNPGWRCPF